MGVTMEYIARIANVSKATVSRVVNGKKEGVGEETRARVQKLIDEYGYTPNLIAQGMATSHSKTIGLVIPDITNPFFPELVQAVETRLRANGYTVMLCNTNSSAQSEEQCIRILQAKRVDGIILATVQHAKQNQAPVKFDVPCVLVDRKSNAINYDVGIFADNEFAFYTATNLMLRHGNRRIAFINGPESLSTTQERLWGYRSALMQYNLPVNEELLFPGNFDFRSGYDAVMTLHRRGTSFTALVSANDMMAFGALQALRELNIAVPDEVEVIGCDNIPFCEMVHPPLTTMGQPVEAIGGRAADVMLDLLAGRKAPERNIHFEIPLVPRKTTREH